MLLAVMRHAFRCYRPGDAPAGGGGLPKCATWIETAGLHLPATFGGLVERHTFPTFESFYRPPTVLARNAGEPHHDAEDSFAIPPPMPRDPYEDLKVVWYSQLSAAAGVALLRGCAELDIDLDQVGVQLDRECAAAEDSLAPEQPSAEPATAEAAEPVERLPTLERSELLVLQAMARQGRERLLTIPAIIEEMGDAERMSHPTVGKAVNSLIEQRLAERPNGPRAGARLNGLGRRVAQRYED